MGALLAAIVLAAASATPAAILGVWRSGDGRGDVAIEACGEALCGRLVRVSPIPGVAVPLDIHNPDPAKRHRHLVGLVMMEGLRHRDDDTWSGGTIYDPATGRTYRVRVRLIDDTHLELRGYLGVPLFGRSDTWTRVTEEGAAGPGLLRGAPQPVEERAQLGP